MHSPSTELWSALAAAFLALTSIGFVFVVAKTDRTLAAETLAFTTPFLLMLSAYFAIKFLAEFRKRGLTYSLTNKRAFVGKVVRNSQKELKGFWITQSTYVEFHRKTPPSITFTHADDQRERISPPHPYLRPVQDALDVPKDAKLTFQDLDDGLNVYRMVLQLRQGGA